MLSKAKLLHTMLAPSVMPIARSPQTTLLAHTATLLQTTLVAAVETLLPQTTLSLPHTTPVDHAVLLLNKRSPHTTLSPQTTFWDHDRAAPAMTVCVGTELRSHQSPVRADVSIALPRAMAPCALISPAPCVITS